MTRAEAKELYRKDPTLIISAAIDNNQPAIFANFQAEKIPVTNNPEGLYNGIMELFQSGKPETAFRILDVPLISGVLDIDTEEILREIIQEKQASRSALLGKGSAGDPCTTNFGQPGTMGMFGNCIGNVENGTSGSDSDNGSGSGSGSGSSGGGFASWAGGLFNAISSLGGASAYWFGKRDYAPVQPEKSNTGMIVGLVILGVVVLVVLVWALRKKPVKA